MGVEFGAPITIMSDASAAIGICHRVGVGKICHIEVTQLWVQEKAANREIAIHKVNSEENLADALTKAVDATAIEDVSGVSAERSSDRHPLTPSVEDGKEEKN